MKSAVKISNNTRLITLIFLLSTSIINGCFTSGRGEITKEPMEIVGDTSYVSINMAPVLTPDAVFLIDRYEVTSLKGKVFFTAPNQDPVSSVTLSEARSICKSLGKNLCKESQWLQACLGTSRFIYGYSSRFSPNRCNVSGDGLRPTGSAPLCLSDGQIHDMIGNATEWVEPDTPTNAGIIAGGSYMSGSEANCFSRQIVSPNSRSPQVGFRCCKNG